MEGKYCAKAILFAVKFALNSGYDQVVIESDCLQVIKQLQCEKSALSSFSLVVDDILS